MDCVGKVEPETLKPLARPGYLAKYLGLAIKHAYVLRLLREVHLQQVLYEVLTREVTNGAENDPTRANAEDDPKPIFLKKYVIK